MKIQTGEFYSEEIYTVPVGPFEIGHFSTPKKWGNFFFFGVKMLIFDRVLPFR